MPRYAIERNPRTEDAPDDACMKTGVALSDDEVDDEAGFALPKAA
jgi:hypothetical protein